MKPPCYYLSSSWFLGYLLLSRQRLGTQWIKAQFVAPGDDRLVGVGPAGDETVWGGMEDSSQGNNAFWKP